MVTTVPCHCKSPQTNQIYFRLAGDNGYKCNDSTKGHCSTNQACFSNNFAKGEWSDGCKEVYTRTRPSYAPPARRTISRLARRHSESLSASVQPRACACVFCVFVHCMRLCAAGNLSTWVMATVRESPSPCRPPHRSLPDRKIHACMTCIRVCVL